MPSLPELADAARATIAECEARLADLRRQTAEEEERLRRARAMLAVAEGNEVTSGTLTDAGRTVKTSGMERNDTARARISAGKFRADHSDETPLAEALRIRGISLQDLSALIKDHPIVAKAGIHKGFTKQQLSAASRGLLSIRRPIAEAVKEITRTPAVKADPSRGIEARPAYAGLPVESWKQLRG